MDKIRIRFEICSVTRDVSTTMIYTDVLNRRGVNVRGQVDDQTGPAGFPNNQLDETFSSNSR